MLNKIKIEKDVQDTQNEVIKHTMIERMIYKDKRNVVDEMYQGTGNNISELVEKSKTKLDTFESIPIDLYDMLNKAKPRYQEEDRLTEKARLFNRQLLSKIESNKKFSTLRKLTMNGDLESIEGAREITEYISNNLNKLLEDITGDQGTLDELQHNKELLQTKKKQLRQQQEVLEKMKSQRIDTKKQNNKVDGLLKQVKYMKKKHIKLENLARGNAIKNESKIESAIDDALDKAINKVQDIKDELNAWSTEDKRPEHIEGKKELLDKVNSNKKFKKMAKHIGRLRRLAEAKVNTSYKYGRGAKCGIEFGDDMNRVLPTELALLATEETKPFFFVKLANKKLKLHKKRETIKKGRGHIIFCGDESGSVKGTGAEYWMKAMAIALMDIAVKEKRNFAYIHYSSDVELEEIDYRNYDENKVMEIANKFLNGGTDFHKPLDLSKKLLTGSNKYKGADIIFVTDGNCDIADRWLKDFLNWKDNTQTKVIGILLDKGDTYVSDISLKKFCNKIYKTSEFSMDSISDNVFGDTL